MCIVESKRSNMRNIYLWCVAVIAQLALCASCQAVEEPSPKEEHEKIYVTFSIAGAENKETRAVPNAPNGTEATGDYESSYKSVDVMFFDSGGNLAELNGRRVFHFDATGFTPPTAEKSNWVDGVYERAGNHRGVYLLDVDYTQVEHKTCVVVLNLPVDVRRRVESRNINSLSGLKNAAAHILRSADEQLGPMPYPKNADGTPDYNSLNFHHIIMIGETPIGRFPTTDLKHVVNVEVERTIAKVKIVGFFSEGEFADLTQAKYPKFTMRFKYKYFPSRTHLGAFWAESNGRLFDPKDATEYVERTGLYEAGKRYFVLNYYMNEYGVLPNNYADQPCISFSATFTPALDKDGVKKGYWLLSLPRGIQRNKSYTIYVNIVGAGSPTAEGYSEETLKAEHVVVKPWEEGVENFFPREYYNFNNFIGNPNNNDDAI